MRRIICGILLAATVTAFACPGFCVDAFTTLGVMIDVSRGRVLKVDYLKTRLMRIRKMGYNAFMLYTEDTFKLTDEPKWGYMRGGYTLEEMKDVKAFADQLGMEMIPCIETLGHLERPLRWAEYADVRNGASTLLVGEEKTYALIDKMLAFWQEAVGGGRIHLNMDEAPGFAGGKCRWLPDEKTRFDVFMRHLGRVKELCAKRGFIETWIAGDAFYRVASKNGEYYMPDTMASTELRARVPKNVRLVYWDYYHDSQEHCEGMIDGHASFGAEPVIYGGIQNWYHFLVDREKTIATAAPLLAAARKKGCREVFFSLWGDDGGYGIPEVDEEGLFACAELAAGRTAEPTDENCRRFQEITGHDYRSLVKLSEVLRHYADEWPDMIHEPTLLYDDPLYCGNVRNYLARKPSESAAGRDFAARHYYVSHYRDNTWRDNGANVLADHLRVLRECSGLKGIPAPANALVRTLAAKLAYELDILAAWKSKDRMALVRLAEKSLPVLIARMKEFDEVFRADWYRTSRPFGYELIQKRNAAQIARLEEAKRRLTDWLAGRAETIEELDETLCPFGLYQENGVIGW